MEIYNKTGVTTSGEIRVNKGISGLHFFGNIAYTDLDDETISIEIERQGKTFDVTKGDKPLKQLVLLATAFAPAVSCDSSGNLSVIINLTPDGNAIHLLEKDVIKITLKGLDATKTYGLDGIEETDYTRVAYTYELKAIGSEDIEKTFDCDGATICTMPKHADIKEIIFNKHDGTSVKHTLREMDAIMRQVDPVASITSAGVVKTNFSDTLQWPLLGIASFTVRKAQGTLFNFYFRK